MSHLLTSGEVGNTHLNHMKQVRKLTLEKWDKLGFLKGLNGHNKDNIAMLYENQATALIKESTTATSSGSFETVVFPIVRRVFSKLLANDIVSVQAMNLPIGKLFFFVPQTSTRLDANGNPVNMDANGRASGDTGSHTSLAADHLPSCVVGVDCEPTQYECKNLYDLYYNDGLFDNSKGDITINVLTLNPVEFAANGCSFVDAATPVVAADGSIRNAILGLSGFSSVNKGRLTGPDGNEMDSEGFLSSLKIVSISGITDPDGNQIIAAGGSVPYRLVTQKYGKGIVAYNDICDNLGTLYVDLDLTHPVSQGGTQTADGYIGAVYSEGTGTTTTIASSSFTISYAQYATLELATEMGEVSFVLDEVTVSVEERKLRATWSPELAQDVSAFHNIDAEAELTAMLSEQIAAEIDREILRDLRHAAAWTTRWDYNGWRKAALAANAYTQKDWNQTLITKVNQISAQIYKATLRGGANFIVVSTEISAIFNDLEYFHVTDASAEQDSYNMGIERVGSLQGRLQVYCDPYSPADSMIIGHKGKSLLDTGYIYAPYIPLQLTPTMYNPFNFAPVKGIMTRYAKKVVNNRFYGHVKVDGVVTFDTRELR